MNADEKRAQKEKIEDEIAVVKREIAALEENTRPIAPDVSLGRLTRMDAIASKGVNEAALNDARGKLQKLEQALEKLDGAGYGICVGCGQPIPPARLEFMPEATTCVNCAA